MVGIFIVVQATLRHTKPDKSRELNEHHGKTFLVVTNGEKLKTVGISSSKSKYTQFT